MSGTVENYAREVLEDKVKVLKNQVAELQKNNKDYGHWMDGNDNKIMNISQEINALEKALVKHPEIKPGG